MSSRDRPPFCMLYALRAFDKESVNTVERFRESMVSIRATLSTAASGCN